MKNVSRIKKVCETDTFSHSNVLSTDLKICSIFFEHERLSSFFHPTSQIANVGVFYEPRFVLSSICCWLRIKRETTTYECLDFQLSNYFQSIDVKSTINSLKPWRKSLEASSAIKSRRADKWRFIKSKTHDWIVIPLALGKNDAPYQFKS